MMIDEDGDDMLLTKSSMMMMMMVMVMVMMISRSMHIAFIRIFTFNPNFTI